MLAAMKSGCSRGLLSGLARSNVSVMLCYHRATMETASDGFLSLGVPITNAHDKRLDDGAGQHRIHRWRHFMAFAILAPTLCA
ncbi:MAG: hypothetical protein WBP38_05455 [Hyphomicrobium sp.]